MTFQKVTIIGGGTLGSQIAYMCAYYNKDVTIYARSQESIERTEKRIDRWEKAVGEYLKSTPADLNNAKDHIRYSTDLKDSLQGADLVIEALPEETAVKDEFYKQFAQLADEDTILVTNTSTLLPSHFADETGRPDKYLGYHFANTIWRNNTAEIMSQSKTDPALPAELKKFSEEIGMVPIMVNKEQPGYVLNSLLIPFLESALLLWSKEISSPEDVDKVWQIGTGAPFGPFHIMDTIGMKTMYDITSMSKDTEVKEAAKKLKEMVDAGNIGRESGKGFYEYS